VAKADHLYLPTAGMNTWAISSIFTFASVGSAFGRTIALLPALLGRSQRGGETAAGSALVGGLIGVVALVAIGVLGADELPRWAEVPPTIVTVQGGFSIVMGRILSGSGPGTLMIGGLSPSEMSFALYGAIVLPATAIFIVVMTVATLLQ
jgi:hypothetical protein